MQTLLFRYGFRYVFRFVLLLLASAGMSFGSLTSVSSPFTEDISTSTLGNFSQYNQVEFFLSGPATFVSSGLSAFSTTGWSDTNVNPTWTEATGSEVASLNFKVNFGDTNLSAPVLIQMFVWNNDGATATLEATGNYVFQYGSFSVNPTVLTLTNYQADVFASEVPEPNPFGLAFVGIGTFVLLGVVRFRRNTA